MDAQRSTVLLIALAIACSSRADRTDNSLIQEGRTYTTWLYENEYRKLWDRFSPEMQQTFGSVADLASFTSRAVQNLGTERGRVDEKVEEGEPFGVYSRSASFDKSRHRMLIEWSLTKDGAVTGLVVRPELPDSEPAGQRRQ
jgi:hypothetical protein